MRPKHTAPEYGPGYQIYQINRGYIYNINEIDFNTDPAIPYVFLKGCRGTGKTLFIELASRVVDGPVNFIETQRTDHLDYKERRFLKKSVYVYLNFEKGDHLKMTNERVIEIMDFIEAVKKNGYDGRLFQIYEKDIRLFVGIKGVLNAMDAHRDHEDIDPGFYIGYEEGKWVVVNGTNSAATTRYFKDIGEGLSWILNGGKIDA